jgi:nitric oxide synthase-interacting protein
VVTQEAVDKIIKQEMIDPINGKKLSEKDIIPIQVCIFKSDFYA